MEKTNLSKISNIFEVSTTVNPDTGDTTINDLTAAKLYEVIASGKLVKISFNLIGTSVTAVTCMSGQVQVIDDENKYVFWMTTPEIKMFSDQLSAEDPVVLSPAGE